MSVAGDESKNKLQIVKILHISSIAQCSYNWRFHNFCRPRL